MKWTKGKSKKDIEDEMYRLSHLIISQGDVDCLLNIIPYKAKKEFIDGWHDEDDLDG